VGLTGVRGNKPDTGEVKMKTIVMVHTTLLLVIIQKVEGL